MSREVGRQAFACLFVCCPHFRAGMAIGKHQPFMVQLKVKLITPADSH